MEGSPLPRGLEGELGAQTGLARKQPNSPGAERPGSSLYREQDHMDTRLTAETGTARARGERRGEATAACPGLQLWEGSRASKSRGGERRRGWGGREEQWAPHGRVCGAWQADPPGETVPGQLHTGLCH